MQIVSSFDISYKFQENLHEMSMQFFWEKNK